VKHKRYLNKAAHPSLPTLRTALEFLFLQVVVIADAWGRKIADGQADASEIAASNAIVKAWAAPGAPRAACDGAFLLERLEDIGAGLGVPRGGAGRGQTQGGAPAPAPREGAGCAGVALARGSSVTASFASTRRPGWWARWYP
jgi:hypothetical protein